MAAPARFASLMSVGALVCASWGAPARGQSDSARILPGDGVEFQQVDFTFPQATQRDTDWMMITADPVVLARRTGIRRGYINIDCDAGWIVRNLLVDLADRYKISTFSRAGIERPVDVRLFNAIVRLSRRPLLSFSSRDRDVFPVTPLEFNGRGADGGEPTTMPGRHVAEQTFVEDAENFSIMLPNLSNVEAAANQCFPASIANSLQYLEDRFGINVPHDNVPGQSGDNSLSGQLDEKAGRSVNSRTSGEGMHFLPMLTGKGAYLQESGLADLLEHSHQGSTGTDDIEVPGLTSTDEGDRLTFEWLCDEIREGNDVELIYDYEDDQGKATGSHAVRVVGCGKQNGVPWIRYAHDANQADNPNGDSRGTVVQRAFLGDIDNDGRLNLEAFNVELRYAVSESVTDEIRNGPQAPPQTSQAATTNAASFLSDALTRGAIATAFGIFNRLLPTEESPLHPEEAAQGAGLPTQVRGATVELDGVLAPLFFVGPGQINFQVPYEVGPGEVSATVTIDGVSSSIFSIEVGATGPGIFQVPAGIAGPGRGVVQNQDFSLNLPSNPASSGEAIVVYLTGLGELDNPVPTGMPASATPLSAPTAPVSATIGGQEVAILFIGMTPGFVGLGQANLETPGLAPGDYPVVITVGGVASNAALVSIGP